MSEFDVDELLPDTQPVKPLNKKPRKTADSRMGATGKQMGLDVAARIKGNIVKGYDYNSGKVLNTTALTPSIKHFEDLHQLGSDLERHLTEHQSYLESNDLHPEVRRQANKHLADAWNSLASFNNVNSQAMMAHIDGKIPGAQFSAQRADYTLPSAADHINATLTHLNKSYQQTGLAAHPIVTNIAKKAASVTNDYLQETKQAVTQRHQDIMDRAEEIASTRTTVAPQRLPMLSARERAAQRSNIARRRDVPPKTVSASEQLMMGRPDSNVEQGPAKQGEVRTPSGGFAPEADVAASHARQHATQQAMVAKEQERASQIRESRKPAPPPSVENFGVVDLSRRTAGKFGERIKNPLLKETTNEQGESELQPILSAPKGRAAPISRTAAENIDRMNRRTEIEPERRAAFVAQQQQAAKATQEEWDTKVGVQLGKQTLRDQINNKIRQTTVDHINAGNYAEAAMFHVKSTMDSAPSRSRGKKKAAGSGDVTSYLRRGLSSKYVAAVQEASANPRKYLSRQGFAVDEVAPQESRQTAVRTPRKRATAGNLETRKPTTATSSPFTPQAEAEYTAKLAESDAAKKPAGQTRAQRNNAAFRGEA